MHCDSKNAADFIIFSCRNVDDFITVMASIQHKFSTQQRSEPINQLAEHQDPFYNCLRINRRFFITSTLKSHS